MACLYLDVTIVPNDFTHCPISHHPHCPLIHYAITIGYVNVSPTVIVHAPAVLVMIHYSTTIDWLTELVASRFQLSSCYSPIGCYDQYSGHRWYQYVVAVVVVIALH